MTYIPPPFQPPQGPLGFDYYRPAPTGLGPARRAAILMWIAAGLMLLCGSGIIATAALVDWDAMMEKSEQIYGPELAEQMKAQGQTSQQVRAGLMVWVDGGIVVAVTFIVLGYFVFRGRIGAIITGVVLTSLLLLVSLCVSGLVILMGSRMGAQAIPAGCIMLLPLIVNGFLLYFLVNAAKGQSASARLRQQQEYQAQQWQMQVQQSLQQGGYGYGAPVKSPGQSEPLPQPASEMPRPPADSSGNENLPGQ